jgi:hypothetical protein
MTSPYNQKLSYEENHAASSYGSIYNRFRFCPRKRKLNIDIARQSIKPLVLILRIVMVKPSTPRTKSI